MYRNFTNLLLYLQVLGVLMVAQNMFQLLVGIKALPVGSKVGTNIIYLLLKYIYSRLSLSQIPRDSLKYFEISVPRHVRFAELRKK